jgi:hypothetical protein
VGEKQKAKSKKQKAGAGSNKKVKGMNKNCVCDLRIANSERRKAFSNIDFKK